MEIYKVFILVFSTLAPTDMHIGDLPQLTALREQYNYLLHAKDKYIRDVLQKNRTPQEYYTLDVGFRLLTLELKMCESKLHYLMFGGELPPEQDPLPLANYLRQNEYVDDSIITMLRKRDDKILKLTARLYSCTQLLRYHRKEKFKFSGLGVIKINR